MGIEPAISVIMLTYNRKNHAVNMIGDILNQTLHNFEFIIVDNGSDDGTAELIDFYARQDMRVKATHLPKSSIGCGRNVGMSMATGQYITFVDDDDRVDRDLLEFLLELTDNGRHDAALCGTDESLDGLTYVPQCVFEEHMMIGSKEAVQLLLERQKIRAGMPGKLFRNKILRKHSFRESCTHEDIFTTYKYLGECLSIGMWGIPKYHFLRNGGNCSFFTTDPSLWTATKLKEYMRAFSERTKWLSERFPDLADFSRYTEWSYMLSMLEKIEKYELMDCQVQQKEIQSELTEHFAEFYSSLWIKDFEREWLNKLLSR